MILLAVGEQIDVTWSVQTWVAVIGALLTAAWFIFKQVSRITSRQDRQCERLTEQGEQLVQQTDQLKTQSSQLSDHQHQLECLNEKMARFTGRKKK